MTTLEFDDCNSGGCTYDVYPDGDCLLFGGSADPIETASGGILLDGTAIDSITHIFNQTATGGFNIDGTATVTQLFYYSETASGGFVLNGSATVTQLFSYNETASGGFKLNKAPYLNGYFYRVLVTIPAGAVSLDIDKFYMGIRADLPTAHLTGTVAVETFAGVNLPCELRKVDNGKVWVFFYAALSASTENKFYLYYGR